MPRVAHQRPPVRSRGDALALFETARHIAAIAARRRLKVSPPHIRATEYDALYSAALEGVWRAAQTYRSEQGSQWKNWAYFLASRSILDYLRVTDALARSHRREGPTIVNEVYDSEQEAYAADPNASDPVAAVDGIDWLEGIARRLPAEEAALLRALHLHGQTHIQVARSLGLSESCVSVRTQKLYQRLREIFRNDSYAKQKQDQRPQRERTYPD